MCALALDLSGEGLEDIMVGDVGARSEWRWARPNTVSTVASGSINSVSGWGTGRELSGPYEPCGQCYAGSTIYAASTSNAVTLAP